MPQSPKYKSQWLSPAAVPLAFEAEKYTLEPLHERCAALDFEALMSCRARLREELQWGEWPPADFTLEANRDDLRAHYEEFTRGEAFAYTVLKPDHSRCLGCVYIERCEEIEGAQLAYWVIDDALDREEELVIEMLAWIHEDWSIKRVLIPLRNENSRGLAIARKHGFATSDIFSNGVLSEHCCFLSEPDKA